MENGQLEVVKLLLREGSQVNKQNPKTGAVVLQWAVICGSVAMTETLLEHGADSSLVNINAIKKREGTDEKTFNECKLLMRAWNLSLPQLSLDSRPNLLSDRKGVHRDPQRDDLRLLSTDHHPSPDLKTLDLCQSDDSRAIEPIAGVRLPRLRSANFETLGDASDRDYKISIRTKDSQSLLRHPVYEMPDQAAAIEALSHLFRHIEHEGVRCDGPLCKDKVTWLTGDRYKCTCCKNVDFCPYCIKSFHNNHDARHAMVKCLLPTECHLAAEVDGLLKQHWLEQCADPTFKTEDLSHAILAKTDDRFLDQVTYESKGEEENACLILSKLKGSPPQLFLVCEGEQMVPFVRDVTTEDTNRFISFEDEDEEKRPSLAYYKIDESFGVRVKNFRLGDSRPIPKEEEQQSCITRTQNFFQDSGRAG